jgi:hypothetical protein
MWWSCERPGLRANAGLGPALRDHYSMMTIMLRASIPEAKGLEKAEDWFEPLLLQKLLFMLRVLESWPAIKGLGEPVAAHLEQFKRLILLHNSIAPPDKKAVLNRAD